jgi:hypothetical protein
MFLSVFKLNKNINILEKFIYFKYILYLYYLENDIIYYSNNTFLLYKLNFENF